MSIMTIIIAVLACCAIVWAYPRLPAPGGIILVIIVAIAAVLVVSPALTLDAFADPSVQLGPRPYFLVDSMSDSKLKRELQQCSEGPFHPSDFSIGHRGAALQFPAESRFSGHSINSL